jgi:hypothetical protein
MLPPRRVLVVLGVHIWKISVKLLLASQRNTNGLLDRLAYCTEPYIDSLLQIWFAAFISLGCKASWL